MNETYVANYISMKSNAQVHVGTASQQKGQDHWHCWLISHDHYMADEALAMSLTTFVRSTYIAGCSTAHKQTLHSLNMQHLRICILYVRMYTIATYTHMNAIKLSWMIFFTFATNAVNCHTSKHTHTHTHTGAGAADFVEYPKQIIFLCLWNNYVNGIVKCAKGKSVYIKLLSSHSFLFRSSAIVEIPILQQPVIIMILDAIQTSW